MKFLAWDIDRLTVSDNANCSVKDGTRDDGGQNVAVFQKFPECLKFRRREMEQG